MHPHKLAQNLIARRSVTWFTSGILEFLEEFQWPRWLNHPKFGLNGWIGRPSPPEWWMFEGFLVRQTQHILCQISCSVAGDKLGRLTASPTTHLCRKDGSYDGMLALCAAPVYLRTRLDISNTCWCKITLELVHVTIISPVVTNTFLFQVWNNWSRTKRYATLVNRVQIYYW